MSGNAEATKISPVGLGSFLGLVTFLATLVAFFFYMPVSMDERKSALLKLIGIVLLHFLVALLVWIVNKIRPTNARIILQVFLGFYDLLQGVILPFLFINSVTNLKTFALAKINAITEVTTCTASSFFDVMT